ncbi:major capsid protein [Dipodfec virus RodF1_24]|uniref:Major capsid protein n=1 Tax=Dipodfec virus RodF1_24 TaxID=2929294 RepID=A0A976N2H1_9VIRU|nr:major capsid protein [Dipodfec virus RodF1_24]
MANVLSAPQVKNHVHRSGFDLSHRNLFTQKVGEILPVCVQEVIPGDKFKVNMSNFMRTQPFDTANFARLRHYVDFYFVPNRLLWQSFPAWIVQTQNSFVAKSITSGADEFSNQPFITNNDIFNYLYYLHNGAGKTLKDEAGFSRYDTSAKLLSNLGYGDYGVQADGGIKKPSVSNTAVNIFPLLAYQKVYQDYFRFKQWEKAAPWTCNLDYIQQDSQTHLTVSAAALVKGTNLFDMRYCNYDKDLFNGVLPTAQFGEEAFASISGNLDLPTILNGSISSYVQPSVSSGDTQKTLMYNNDGLISQTAGQLTYGARINVDPVTQEVQTSLSILSLRQAEALQKWKEITLMADPDYKSQLEAHWNVHISSALSDTCKYVGGMAQNIDISEVINQNLADNNAANLAGNGKLAQNGFFEFESDEYGILIGVSHIKPVIEWSADAVMSPFMFRHLSTDYAIPEFDSLGMQAMTFDVFPQLSATLGANYKYPPAFGYLTRYFDYKTSYDRVNGAFKNSLSNWVLMQRPPLSINQGKLTDTSYLFFKVFPQITDNLFVSTAAAGGSSDSDQFFNSLYLDIKVVRNLSYDGMPY